MLVQDAALAASLMEEAARRLRESAAFNRGDTDPQNALGEVLVVLAEATPSATETLALYNAALEEGFS